MTERDSARMSGPVPPGSAHAGMAPPAAETYGPLAGGHPDGRALWEGRTRIVLGPVAAPSILGWFGFFAATLMVGTLMAGWWGDRLASPQVMFPFIMIFGGVAQFLAGMWAYKARDGLATAMHGTWGAFWFAYGLYELLVSTGTLPAPTGVLSPEFGFWFIPLCVITLSGMLAALGRNMALFTTLLFLTGACGLAAAGYMGGYLNPVRISGWLFVASAAAAWYTATAMLLEATHGRAALPLGRWSPRRDIPRDDIPGLTPDMDAVYPMEPHGWAYHDRLHHDRHHEAVRAGR